MRRLIWLILLVPFLGGMLWVALPQIRLYQAYQTLRAETAPSSLPLPIANLNPAQVQNTWGAPRSGDRAHQGLDLFAPRDTPVLATTRGVVSYRGEDPLGGNVIYVVGPGGYRHYYAHLERYGEFNAGDWVKPGDVLGFVGDSGNAKGTPTHLHYGLYTPDWKAVNPYPYFKGGE